MGLHACGFWFETRTLFTLLGWSALTGTVLCVGLQYKPYTILKNKTQMRGRNRSQSKVSGADIVVPAPRKGGIDHLRVFSSRSDRRT